MNKRINSLQTVRALAFLGIFASHSRIKMFAAFGPWGVSVFLVLSGFLMFLSYGDTDRISFGGGIRYNLKFGINKIRRLYPLHIVTLLSALPFLIKAEIGRGGIRAAFNIIIKTALNLTLLQTWVPSSSVYVSMNGPSWYLSVTLFLYIVFPVILRFMRKYKGVKDALTVLFCVLFFQIGLSLGSAIIQEKFYRNDEFVYWFSYIFPISRMEDFIIGCNLGYIFKYSKRGTDVSATKATVCELLLIATFVAEWVVYVFIVFGDKSNWWGYSAMYTLSSCALIYLAAINKGKIVNFLTNKVMMFLASISANGFLIHEMVYRYLIAGEKALFGEINQYLNLFLCFIITVLCCVLWDKLCMTIHAKRNRKTYEYPV